jgi:hypothetical protein
MRNSGPDEGAYTDRRLRLEGGESRKVDLPFYFVQGTKIVVLEIGPDGQVVASAEKQVTSPEGRVVAVVCSSTPTCTATAQAIRAGNSIEERKWSMPLSRWRSPRSPGAPLNAAENSFSPAPV